MGKQLNDKDSKVVRVGKNGQISIGKEFAGETVMIEYTEGSMQVTPVDIIPKHMKTFYTEEAKASLDDFEKWAAENPPTETNLDEYAESLTEKKAKTVKRRKSRAG